MIQDKKNSPKENNLKIVCLGGLGEVGENMTLFEYQGKILILDIGLMFPGENMPGVDCVIPNIEYLKGREKDIVGVLFTHGHYDHIGAVPYIMNKIWRPELPIYASALTKAIILKRQEEVPNQPKLNINTIKDGDKINLFPFSIEFFHQAHTIPDNLGMVIKTPLGNIVHTSDFKFDANPIYDKPTDFQKLKLIAQQGVWILMSDSTGAEEEGHSLSEETIMKNLETIFKQSKGKIVASSFGSLINRIQQIITLSEKYGRYVAIDGNTMKTNIEICRNLKYVKIKKDTIIPAKKLSSYPPEKITLICTGAQGEEKAVLARIASGEYPNLKIDPKDTVIFSSSTVPGNERTVQALKDEFFRQKAEVYHYKMMDIHASGHARQEELKEMISIMKPKFFFPVHGQFSMLASNAKLAQSVGIKEENIIFTENGQIIDFYRDKFEFSKKKAPSEYVMVDGLGIGDVGEVVLRDRNILSKDGIFVIITIVDHATGKVRNSPDIISRGFIYLRESKDLLTETRRRVVKIISRSTGKDGAVNWNYIKNNIRNELGEYLFKKTQRRPMVLPVIIEV
ncbi:MAG TPA: ribonuclease J [Candidatus Pacearchaeota archaeon]|nr:ribonuclease J [Candidatus Parcubacteria bacterium]HNZ83904.1 ribonuclease J [Candidatus Pacearchaeota archaeon]HOU45769.1 ribonuclease J [Candidatus Pacearchaeota archaeon]HQI74498.1 ribonuclease J [Candidatus Pacearchaeota archaeon]